MRYLSKRLRVSQPPSWRPLNDSVAANLRLAGARAIFGDGSCFLGGRTVQERIQVRPDLLTTSSRMGRSLYTGAQWGGRIASSPLRMQRNVLYGVNKFTAVFTCKYESPGSDGYGNWVTLLLLAGVSDNANISMSFGPNASNGYQAAASVGLTQSWTPTTMQFNLPVGFDGVCVVTWDGAHFAAYVDDVPTSFSESVSSTTSLWEYGTVESPLAGVMQGGAYTRQTGNYAALFAKLFSRPEISAISRNPFMVFA